MNFRLPRGDFARNVLAVMGGTLIAQAIPVALSPVITRLYTPADLGLLALYSSIVAISLVLATGRYELAILLPRLDREAFDLMVFAISLAAVFCAITWILLLAFKFIFPLGYWGSRSLGNSLYLLPLSVMMAAAYQCLSYWNNRRQQYRDLAISRIVQSGAMCGVQVAAGFVHPVGIGLVSGHLLGQTFANSVLLGSNRNSLLQQWQRCNGTRLLAVARRHRAFPTFMIPGQLANVASAQMPVLMLGLLYDPGIAGYYSLAERVLVLPSSLIGSAIGDVFRQRAAQDYLSTGNCREIFLKTIRKLALLAFFPITCAIIFGPSLFAAVFGPTWRTAGEITTLIGSMVFFQIVSSPLSQTVLLANMQRLDMIWQVTRLVFSVASIYLGYALFNSYKMSIIFYVSAFSILYILHSLMQYSAARGSRNRTLDTIP